MPDKPRQGLRFIVVADIVGSTRLYESLGDVPAKQIITECLDGLTSVVNEHHGAVVASVGDELVCCFEDIAEAAASACEMQIGVRQDPDGTLPGKRSVQLRVGIHGGDIIFEPFDFVSEVTAIARRVTALAKADQTLLTRTVVDSLPGVYRAMTRYVDREPWRGVTTHHLDLYELVWAVDGVTAMATLSPAHAARGFARIRLQHPGGELVVDENRPVITVGRASINDIVVDFDMVSREHFKLTLRNGRGLLTDSSTNGTVIVGIDGTSSGVLRETEPLPAQGTLFFGTPSRENESYSIRFTCE
ncbi:MAG: adenylate/guanylate cyclase domain-containing protein [Gammaproteobacteria bacterium]|nr:adenylate/guanylate cyclase domain-containing protein [Gammaproteobacteria bacterium]